MIFTICVLAWYLSGISFFAYWWTEDNDYDTSALFFSLFVGLLGPIAGVAGYFIHGNKNPKVIFKQRARK